MYNNSTKDKKYISQTSKKFVARPVLLYVFFAYKNYFYKFDVKNNDLESKNAICIISLEPPIYILLVFII